jgi:hypothetical protein
MAQEFTINSTAIEDKINQLLPSQGGFGAGVDFSASTMVIPIVDLTESAEGSSLRSDLQRAYSHTQSTHTLIENTTTTLLTTTGYYQVDLAYCIQSETTAIRNGKLIINDGTTDKIIFQMSVHQTSAGANANGVYQTVVFLGAGDSLKCTSDDDQVMMNVVTRQIADISGNLVNPT